MKAILRNEKFVVTEIVGGPEHVPRATGFGFYNLKTVIWPRETYATKYPDDWVLLNNMIWAPAAVVNMDPTDSEMEEAEWFPGNVYETDELADMPLDRVYLRLFHGRSSPDDELQDWGDDGPFLGPIEWCHTTYANCIKIRFEREDDIPGGDADLWVELQEDLFPFNGIYYGDWSLFVNR